MTHTTVTIPYEFNPNNANITLRDRFAGIALAALSNEFSVSPTGNEDSIVDERMRYLACLAYKAAACMLSERKQWEADPQE